MTRARSRCTSRLRSAAGATSPSKASVLRVNAVHEDVRFTRAMTTRPFGPSWMTWLRGSRSTASNSSPTANFRTSTRRVGHKGASHERLCACAPEGDRRGGRRPLADAARAPPPRYHAASASLRGPPADAGDRIINEHDESGRRRGALPRHSRGGPSSSSTASGVDAPAGTFVFVRPGVKRTAFAEEAGTTIVAVGGDAAARRTRPPAGRSGRRSALYEAGEYAEVADRCARWSTSIPSTHCCSTTSRAARASPADGRGDRAPRKAIELSEKFREYAKHDSDLDPVREEPAFRELVGA